MNNLSRSMALKTAAVLSFIASAVNIVLAVPIVAKGADAVNQDPEMIPFAVVMLALVLGVIGVVAAYGTWKQQRWGIILTIVTTLLNGLSAAPGLLFAPTMSLQISATITVVGAVVIIVLCLWRDRRVAAV